MCKFNNKECINNHMMCECIKCDECGHAPCYCAEIRNHEAHDDHRTCLHNDPTFCSCYTLGDVELELVAEIREDREIAEGLRFVSERLQADEDEELRLLIEEHEAHVNREITDSINTVTVPDTDILERDEDLTAICQTEAGELENRQYMLKPHYRYSRIEIIRYIQKHSRYTKFFASSKLGPIHRVHWIAPIVTTLKYMLSAIIQSLDNIPIDETTTLEYESEFIVARTYFKNHVISSEYDTILFLYRRREISSLPGINSENYLKFHRRIRACFNASDLNKGLKETTALISTGTRVILTQIRTILQECLHRFLHLIN
jgi:hypothetical protein